MTFAKALVEAVKVCPFTARSRSKIGDLRKIGPLPIDYYLGDLTEQYPPADFKSLTQLVGSIEESSKITAQEQALLLFYIFQAFESVAAGKGLAEYYAQQLQIPASWQNYAKCLWCVEQQQNDEALRLLGVFLAPNPVLESLIAHFSTSPAVLCMFFETHRTSLKQNLAVHVSALCHESLYFSVLEILRDSQISSQESQEILELVGEHAAGLTSGPAMQAFVSVPWLDHEWQVIQSFLEEVPDQSPAHKINLVRALHLGDLATIQRYKQIPEFALLTRSYDDY